MTLKELAARIKKHKDPIETVRQTIGEIVGEYTAYKPTARWKEILASMDLGELESVTVCVTAYNTNEAVFDQIKNALGKKYKHVIQATADELNYRKLFICGNNPDAQPELMLAVNYYEQPRESVKATYRSDEDTADDTEAEASDLDFDDIDPFE